MTAGLPRHSTVRCILLRPRPTSVARWVLSRRIGDPVWVILILAMLDYSVTASAVASASRLVHAATAEQVGDLLAATLGDRARAGLFLERLEGRPDHVVGVRRADRLGDHVGDAKAFEHGAHRAAGDDAGTRRSRANGDLAGAEVAVAVMVQRAAVAQRNADHRLLGGRGRLGDRFRHFARLAVAEAGAALAVADHDQRREAEALAALHRLRDAVDVDQLLDQLLAAVIVAATAATAIVATATVAAATIVAAAAGAATATAAARAAASGRSAGAAGAGFAGAAGFGFGAAGGFGSGVGDLRGFVFVSHLELQSAFAGGIGQGLHPAMEQEAAAVEHDAADAGLLGALGKGLADRRPRRRGSPPVLPCRSLSRVEAAASVLPAASSMTWA